HVLRDTIIKPKVKRHGQLAELLLLECENILHKEKESTGREQKHRMMVDTLSPIVRRLEKKGLTLAILVQCHLSIPEAITKPPTVNSGFIDKCEHPEALSDIGVLLSTIKSKDVRGGHMIPFQTSCFSLFSDFCGGNQSSLQLR
ncbi:hypothetical protein STEG23_005920, partial [Scotinomys teguina]